MSVPVAVGDEHLVRLRVDFAFSRLSDIGCVGIALALALAAYLQQELALASELEHMVIGLAIGGEPDVVPVVNGQTVCIEPGHS